MSGFPLFHQCRFQAETRLLLMRWVWTKFQSISQRAGAYSTSHLVSMLHISVCFLGKVWDNEFSPKALTWGASSHFFKGIVIIQPGCICWQPRCCQTQWSVIHWARAHLEVAWLPLQGISIEAWMQSHHNGLNQVLFERELRPKIYGPSFHGPIILFTGIVLHPSPKSLWLHKYKRKKLKPQEMLTKAANQNPL